MLLVIFNRTVNAKTETINAADTELSETFKMALISSLREPVDKAIVEIYKDDKNAPNDLTWASYDTEILKIKQVYGIGGLYEITLKVYPYYRAHMSYLNTIAIGQSVLHILVMKIPVKLFSPTRSSSSN